MERERELDKREKTDTYLERRRDASYPSFGGMHPSNNFNAQWLRLMALDRTTNEAIMELRARKNTAPLESV